MQCKSDSIIINDEEEHLDINTEVLSEKEYWDRLFERSQLPRIINIEHYNYYRFDLLFKIILGENYKNARFLELGCAASAWLVYFAKEFGYEVAGVDYSEIGCKLAEENLRLNTVKGQVFCENVFNIDPSKLGKFDIIFSYGLIEHFSEPLEILKIIDSLLNTGGIVISIVPNLKGIYGLVSKTLYPEIHYKHKVIDALDMKSYIEKAGFNTVIADYFGTSYIWVVAWSYDTFLPKWCMKYLLFPAIGGINRISNFLLRKLKVEYESRFFSPYVVGIGKKSPSSECTKSL